MKSFLILYSAPNNVGITVGMGYIPICGSYEQVLCWIRYDRVEAATSTDAYFKAKPKENETTLNAVEVN